MKLRDIVTYTSVFLVVVVEYAFRRAFDFIAGPLGDILHLSRSDLMILPSIFIWATFLTVFFGKMVDRKPKLTLILGGIISFVGFMACAACVADFSRLRIFMIPAAIGSVMIEVMVAAYMVKLRGFGRTWDLLTLGWARTSAVLIFAAVISAIFWLGFGVAGVFAIMAIWQVFFLIIFYLSIRGAEYERKDLDQVKYLKLAWIWMRQLDFWRIMLTISMFETVTVLMGARFTEMFKAVNIGETQAKIWFVMAYVIGLGGRVVWSRVGNKYSTRWPLVLGPLLMATSFLLFPLGPICARVSFVLYGLGTSAGTTNIRSYLGDRYGQEQIGMRLGLAHSGYSVVAGLLVYCSTFFLRTLGFQGMLFFYAMIVIAVVLFFGLERNIQWKNPRNGTVKFWPWVLTGFKRS